MRAIAFATILVAALSVQPVLADDAHHKGSQPAATASASPMSEGEVRKVDKAGKKITLKHGPLVNLDMPGMTMVFQVADPAMLDRVKVGDKVKFVAGKVGDNYTVTKIEPAR